MGKHKLAFVAFDSAKEKHAVAIADEGRDGEVRYLGEIDNSPDAIRKLVAKLSRQYERLHFCYEAGPTGYGLHRQLTDLGHVCDVIAPTMIPKRSGDRVKTNRRDSVALVKLLRAGELRAIWVPDSVHEAVRDLTRAREVAMLDLKKKRQQLLGFLLRHSRIYPGGKNWTKMRVTRATPVQTAVRNCTRDEGRSFGFGNQVLIPSHRKLLRLNAVVVSVAETPGR
jgi:transposase